MPERLIPPRGEILIPLDEAAVCQAARELKAAGVLAIAVGFLFSSLDAQHEERAREIITEEYPQCFVTTSASVAPQFWEFEQLTTAAMNAFIGPKVRDYVNRLAGALTAASIPTLPSLGIAFGAATAGLVANTIGLAEGVSYATVTSAATRVYSWCSIGPRLIIGLVPTWRMCMRTDDRYDETNGSASSTAT